MGDIRLARKAPRNPYDTARREWNERNRSLLRAKYNWQLLALVAIAANAGLAWGLVHLASASRVVPYVVRVDEVGQALVIERATAGDVADEPVLAWQLQDYVRKVRQITPDRTAQKALLEEIYSRTDGPAVQFLNDHFRRDNPFETLTRRSVGVSIRSLLRVAGDTWQVEWKETARGLDGKLLAEEDWTGQFAVEVNPPETEDAILANPLGSTVTHITWTRQL